MVCENSIEEVSGEDGRDPPKPWNWLFDPFHLLIQRFFFFHKGKKCHQGNANVIFLLEVEKFNLFSIYSKTLEILLEEEEWGSGSQKISGRVKWCRLGKNHFIVVSFLSAVILIILKMFCKATIELNPSGSVFLNVRGRQLFLARLKLFLFLHDLEIAYLFHINKRREDINFPGWFWVPSQKPLNPSMNSNACVCVRQTNE